MYSNFLNQLQIKYNYDEDLMKAIEISIPILVDMYGDNYIEDILNLFDNVKIYDTSNMSKENRTKIEKEMVGTNNSHIIYEDLNPYGNDKDPGAYYSYEPIFDNNMNYIEEKRWIVANKDDKYKKIFGTSINIPYFLHELNHAFAMQKSICEIKANTITLKHGMFLKQEEFNKNEDKVYLKDVSADDIILEEMINERYTQLQLTKMLNKQNYKEVSEELNKIHHVKTSYSNLLIELSEQFEKLLTKDKINDYRINNNMKIKEEFNDIAVNSNIYKKYIPNENPWDYFSKKCYEIFKLSCEAYKYDMETYKNKLQHLYIEANIPLSSYRDVKYGTRSLEEFDEIVNSILPKKNQENDTKVL